MRRRTPRVILFFVVVSAVCTGHTIVPPKESTTASTQPFVVESSARAARVVEPEPASQSEPSDLTPVSDPEIPPTKLGYSPSLGCDNPQPQADSMPWAGVTRTWIETRPTGADADALPLILDFHGFTQDPATQNSLSELTVWAEAIDFMVVQPQGSGPVSYWNLGSHESNDLADDVGFVNALLDQIEASACIDVDSVYVTGFSNGAMFSSSIACALPDRITAFASVGGAFLASDCAAQPVAGMIIHGDADQMVPFYGPVPDQASYIDLAKQFAPAVGSMFSEHAEAIPVAAADWASHNGCDEQPSISDGRKGSVVLRYQNCEEPVEFVALPGVAHEWTGRGGATDEFPVTAAILEFFSSV